VRAGKYRCLGQYLRPRREAYAAVSEITGGGAPSREFHDVSAGTGLWANKLESSAPCDTAPPKLGLRRTNGNNGVTLSQRPLVLKSRSNKLAIMKTLKLRTWPDADSTDYS
jgi:hypothetical protein